MLKDTIAAVSTPPGKGGVAVIRISGTEAVEITGKIFRMPSGKKLSEAPERYASFGEITDENENIIDQVLVTCFYEPRSFTGENVCEISCHGGSAVTDMILKELVKNGARLAKGGEFTRRAFINGKLDLAQAEAVMDIISAEDEYGVRSGEMHLKGALAEKTDGIRQALVDIVSNILAVIDYPDEEITDLKTAEIINTLEGKLKETDELIATYNTGKIIREGADIVIAGKPNAGKSSLLNAFLNEERAIVTDIAGTTRDILEEQVSLGGLKARITDTAGIRESGDTVEKIGIERAVSRVKEADLVIFVADNHTGITAEDIEIAQLVKGRPSVGVINKSDLEGSIDEEEIKALTGCERVFEISAEKRSGIPQLTEYIKSKVLSGEINVKDNLYITNRRHYEALLLAKNSIKKAANALKTGMFADMVTIDIENAISALGEISGETVSEEIISNIFSKFCVGK